jgi:hypothetical protein
MLLFFFEPSGATGRQRGWRGECCRTQGVTQGDGDERNSKQKQSGVEGVLLDG